MGNLKPNYPWACFPWPQYSQETPHNLWKPKDHYHTHNSPYNGALRNMSTLFKKRANCHFELNWDMCSESFNWMIQWNDLKKDDNSIFKNDKDRWEISYLSKHLPHVKWCHSLVSPVKICILWVFSFLQKQGHCKNILFVMVRSFCLVANQLYTTAYSIHSNLLSYISSTHSNYWQHIMEMYYNIISIMKDTDGFACMC